MRKSGAPATLGEMMGSAGSTGKKLSMDDLPELLGEKMPEISHDSVGKIRLVHALQQRFGDGFMSMPGVRGIIDHFHKQMQAAQVVKLNGRANG